MSNNPLVRLGDVLAERGAPVEAMLRAVQDSGATRVYIAASAFTPRIDLLLPFTPEALQAVAPTVPIPEIPPHAMLRCRAEGSRLDAAMIVNGATTPTLAISGVAPPDADTTAWRALVGALLAVPMGNLSSFTRSLTDGRGTIAVRFPPHDGAEEQLLRQCIERTGVSLGISPPQRELWGRLHEAHGEGPAVTVSTDGVAGRPSPELGFLYRVSGWDHAVTLTNLIAGGDAARARRAAAALGRLSGALSIPGLSSIEILLGAETDVLVWLMLPTG